MKLCYQKEKCNYSNKITILTNKKIITQINIFKIFNKKEITIKILHQVRLIDQKDHNK